MIIESSNTSLRGALPRSNPASSRAERGDPGLICIDCHGVPRNDGVRARNDNYFWPMVLGTFLTLTAVGLPIFFVVAKNDKPTGTMLSPLPAGTQARSPQSFAQSVNLAQNYLNKAFDLSRNPNQSEGDKKAIMVSLNQSLTQATNSINLAPNQPEGYLLRAQVLTAISKINPAAAKLAQQDLELVARLAHDQDVVLPAPINPVNLLPDEQASNNSNIIIASPAEASAEADLTTSTSSNANQKRFILPAGQTEMTIKDSLVRDGSFIYLIPSDNHNLIVSLKNKSAGSFAVSIDSAAGNDIPIDYYIINE